MVRMRVIGSSFDKGYRDDLNYNFGLLEALIGEANGLTDALREEMLEKIYNLQQQIDMLTGENIGELLERLNDSIQQALTAAQEARTAKTATEEATALATTATELAKASALLAEEKANYANEKAVLAQEAADNANQEASNLSQLKVDVVQATQEANTATGNANQATQAAQTATEAINIVLPNVTGLVNLKEWNIETQYQKNNFVTLEGNGYMALRGNKGVRPPSFPVLSNADWAMFVQKGEKGEQGTGVRILGTLPDEGSLPPTGEPGDAYLINGDLYVWSDTTDDWTNVGTIKGPKGDTGPQGPEGPQGPPGKDADLTEINQKVDEFQTEVTDQLAEMKPKVDNSWQRNKENSVTVSNMGSFTAEKVLLVNQSDWKNTGNVEQLDIVIPVGGSFSGLIKATYTSFWGGSDSHGGATVLYRIGNYISEAGMGERLNDYVLETISPDFAKDFYIHKPYINPESGTIALMLNRSPAASNPFIIKLELQGYSFSNKSAFQILEEAHFTVWDKETPTANGYPWTPQTSRIPTGTDFSNWNSTAHRLQPKCAVVSNWNMVKDNGFYMGEPVALNAPTKEWWMGFVVAHNDSYVVQKLINVTGGSEFERQCYNGVWENWIETSPRKLFQSVSNGKATVNQAVTDMGVYTPPDATFATTAANIRAIPKGRKEAKGVAYASNVSGRARIIVTGLSFHPTAILITKENNNNNEFKSIYAPSNVFFDNNSNAYMNFFTYNETGSLLAASPALVSNYQGFEMTVSMTYNSRSEGAYRWFAFG